MTHTDVFERRAREIVSLRKQGCTYQSIGEKYQITRERVRQILGEEGVKPPGVGDGSKGRALLAAIAQRRADRLQRNKQIIKLAAKGDSFRTIARRFNLAPTYINAIANAGGVRRRRKRRSGNS